MTLLLIAVGAAIGAPARYLVDRAIQARHDTPLPWGTLIVNTTGSLALGVLAGLPTPGQLMVLAGTGFCGAFTTFSTFSYESLRLVRDGAHYYAAVNVAVSVVAGVGTGYLGFTVARALSG